jgi:entericidin B
MRLFSSLCLCFTLFLPLNPHFSKSRLCFKSCTFTATKKDMAMLKKSIVAIFSVLVLSSVLTACNTTRGVGEDVSAGGKAIQRSAQ